LHLFRTRVLPKSPLVEIKNAKTTSNRRPFLIVRMEARGVEPLSEDNGTSPSCAGFSHNFDVTRVSVWSQNRNSPSRRKVATVNQVTLHNFRYDQRFVCIINNNDLIRKT